MKKYFRTKILAAVLVSAIIHLGLLVSIVFFENPDPLVLEKKPIYITLVEESPSNKAREKLIVRDLDTPKEIQKEIQNSDDPAMFLSSRMQRVKKQTRSLNVGPTRNSFAPKPLMPRLKENTVTKAQIGLGGFNIPPPTLPIESTLGTLLPNEIEIGSFTALNTDKFTYYSFFERIEDKIRYRWENQVRMAINKIPTYELARYPKKMAITNLEIILSREGYIEKILLTRSSGLQLIDEAPAKAFWDAKNFMNPPQGLLESDNKIHLRYQFVVYLK
jgi:hypothetical protein